MYFILSALCRVFTVLTTQIYHQTLLSAAISVYMCRQPAIRRPALTFVEVFPLFARLSLSLKMDADVNTLDTLSQER